jgi:hypothetical protein
MLAVVSPLAAGAQTPPPPQSPTPQSPTPQSPTPAPPPRPFAGLFRGAPTAPQSTLAVLFYGYGGYDNDRSLRGDESPVVGNGPYSGFDADLSYAPPQRGTVNFDARATTSLRYYTDVSDAVAASQLGSLGISVLFSPRVTLLARGGASYTPYFDYVTLPGMDEPLPGVDVPSRIPDGTLETRKLVSYDGGLDFNHATTDRTSYALRYAVRLSELLDENQRATDQTVSASLSHRFGRRTSGRLAYVHRAGQYRAGALDRPVRVDDVEFGLDKTIARSPTRQSTISVTVGPSFVEQQGQRLVRAFGGLAVTHPFARSWSTRAQYRRGVQFVANSERPYFSDSATVSISGLVSRRVDVSGSFGAVLGDLGLEGGVTPFDTYSASARVRYGVTRTLAVYGEYLWNYSTYSDDSATAALDRSGVRFGLTWHVPLSSEREPRSR